MSNEVPLELIRRSSFASDLDEAQSTVLAGIVTMHCPMDGEALIEQGQTDETLYIIGEGALAVERKTSGGDVLTLHVLKAGDLAGEMGFVDGTEHTATLRAVGKTVVVGLRREDLESVLSDHPDVVYAVMRGVVRTVHRILRQMNLQYVELTNYITKTHGRY